MQAAVRSDARGLDALRGKCGRRLVGQSIRDLGQFRHGMRFERNFHGLFAHHRLVSKTHAIGGEHAGIRVDKHGLHAERVGDQAGMLPAGAAEALQREAGGVVALLHRDLLDGIRHVGDRDVQEALGHLARGARLAGGFFDLVGEGGEFFPHDIGIERLVAVGSEDRREMPRLNFPHADIRVRHCQRAAAAIARGARIGAGAVGSDAEPRAVEMQDRAAAGRHRVDRHHRRAQPHAGHCGFKRPLERAGVERHVGRRAAHVEADDAVEPGHRGGARRAHDAAGGTREDRVLALKARGVRQAAVRLHEEQPHARELRRHVFDVASQDGREIRIHHRGVAARDQPQQRADGMAGGDLREAGLAREFGEAAFVVWVFPGVHQHDGAGADAVGTRPGERGARGVFVERSRSPRHRRRRGRRSPPRPRTASTAA